MLPFDDLRTVVICARCASCTCGWSMMMGLRSLLSHPNDVASSRLVRTVVGITSVLTIVLAGASACSSDPTAAAGPPNPSGKVEGAECTDGSECQSLTCKAGKCTPVTGGNPTDQRKNGDETDIDCGGASAPKCLDGKSCKAGDDCQNGACKGGVCVAPAPDDGLKNGDETDVDCGGTKAPKCTVDKACTKNEDCATDACSYAKKCVEFPSCTGHFGGDTCGEGETGEADAKHESCCATVNETASGLRVGKYYVTAGRMRAFVERFDGNLQAWAATNPKNWNSEWNDQLPSSMDDALSALGPNNKRGCNVPEQGGRTYWQKNANGDPDENSDFSKDVLDEKALNCVTWHMAQALCHFDGGRLASSDEILALIRNDGTTSWPWGNSPSYKMQQQLDQLVAFYSYQTPNPPASMRTVGDNPLDKAFFIAPPGRRPLGANKIGVEDAMGLVLPWVDDGPNSFAWTASWEQHEPVGVNGRQLTTVWPPPDSRGGEADGYYAIGARCVFE